MMGHTKEEEEEGQGIAERKKVPPRERERRESGRKRKEMAKKILMRCVCVCEVGDNGEQRRPPVLLTLLSLHYLTYARQKGA